MNLVVNFRDQKLYYPFKFSMVIILRGTKAIHTSIISKIMIFLGLDITDAPQMTMIIITVSLIALSLSLSYMIYLPIFSPLLNIEVLAYRPF